MPKQKASSRFQLKHEAQKKEAGKSVQAAKKEEVPNFDVSIH